MSIRDNYYATWDALELERYQYLLGQMPQWVYEIQVMSEPRPGGPPQEWIRLNWGKDRDDMVKIAERRGKGEFRRRHVRVVKINRDRRLKEISDALEQRRGFPGLSYDDAY